MRTAWRLALFILIFMALARVELWLLPPLATGAMPADRISAGLIYQGLILLVAALVAGWIMLVLVEQRPARALGLAVDRRTPADLGAGLAIGAGGVGLVVLLMALPGAFRYTAEPGTVGGWLAMAGRALVWLAIPAAAEEAVFRGYAFRTLVDGVGPVAATLLMSAVFAAVHGGNPNVALLGLANIFLAGVLLSAAVVWSGSLWLAIAVHLGWNWAIAGPLDLPVSGLAAFDAPLYDAVPAGPAWLTGGAFGPEGGLAGTAAVLVALGLLRWYTRAGRTARSPEHGREQRGEDR